MIALIFLTILINTSLQDQPLTDQSLRDQSLKDQPLKDQPLQAWYGESPWCFGNWYKCEPFDMDLVKFDKYGDGKLCLAGNKVLCQVRGTKIPEIKSQDTQINVMSYNVYQRQWITTHDGQVERTCRIPRMLAETHPEVDVIVLQEVFMGGCTGEANFSSLLSHFGWPYQSELVGKSSFFNGGVMIASKYMLNDIQYRIFKQSADGTADALTAKGFVYSWMLKGSKKYHIVGTQLLEYDGAKGDKIRNEQVEEIHQFLKDKHIPEDEPVLIAGDINVDKISAPKKVEKLLELMNVTVLENTGALKYTYDPLLDDVVEHGKSPAWYDYIGYKNENQHPTYYSLEAIDLKSDKEFSYCNAAPKAPFWIYEKSFLCRVVKKTKDLSDHFPIIANMKF